MRIRILHIALFFVALIGAVSCHKSWQIESFETGYYRMNREEADSSIQAMIEPYHDSLAQEMNVVIDTLDFRLKKEKPNGLLGFFTCDAFRAAASFKSKKAVDIAVLNNGGIRRPYLGPGTISIGQMYELMPFDNRAMLLELDSAEVYGLALFLISKGGDPISGLKISSKAELKIEVNGLPLSSRNYLLTCTDYQYNGGDGYEFLKNSKLISSDLGLLRDLLIDAVQENLFSVPSEGERRYYLD